jgi:hypothetical protein
MRPCCHLVPTADAEPVVGPPATRKKRRERSASVGSRQRLVSQHVRSIAGKKGEVLSGLGVCHCLAWRWLALPVSYLIPQVAKADDSVREFPAHEFALLHLGQRRRRAPRSCPLARECNRCEVRAAQMAKHLASQATESGPGMSWDTSLQSLQNQYDAQTVVLSRRPEMATPHVNYLGQSVPRSRSRWHD